MTAALEMQYAGFTPPGTPAVLAVQMMHPLRCGIITRAACLIPYQMMNLPKIHTHIMVEKKNTQSCRTHTCAFLFVQLSKIQTDYKGLNSQTNMHARTHFCMQHTVKPLTN